jgi:hypothetical protein
VRSFRQCIHRISWRHCAQALVTTCLLAAFPALPLLAQQTRAEYDSLVTLVAREDSTGPRGPLKRAIGSFESQWRAMWQIQQFARHGQFDTVAVYFDNRPREARVRRLWSLQCAQVTPGKVLAFSSGVEPRNHALAPIRMKPVVTSPDHGVICPLWYPPDDKQGNDESENIDLALYFTQRDSARMLRAQLIGRLENEQKKSPRDSWIVGQLVRFLHDQGDTARMIAVADQCQGDEIMCGRFRGFALAKARRLVEAETAFRRADSIESRLARKGGNCATAGYVTLFDVYAKAHWSAQSCVRQEQLLNNTWWLSDPLWSVPGSERYIEHQVRRLHVVLRSARSTDERYVWDKYGGGDSMRETIVRYGWPSHTFWAGWVAERGIGLEMEKFDPILRPERKPPPQRISTTRPAEPSLSDSVFRMETPPPPRPVRILFRPLSSKEYFTDRTALLPNFAAIRDPFSLLPEHYLLTNPDLSEPDRWWPQEHMWLPYTIAPLDSGQSLMLRRDSSITYQHSIDDPLRKLDSAATGPSRAFLMGGTSANDTRELSNALIAKDLTLRLGATLTSNPIVLSTEIHHRTLNEPALRLRMGVHPPPTLRDMRAGDVAMSMPVFLRLPNRSMPLPTEEAEIKRYMAGSTQFSQNEVLALYWESYGLTPGDTVQVDLRIRRIDDRNVLRVIGAMFGVVASHRDSVSIKWTEPDGSRATKLLPADVPIIARTVAIDITGIAPGEYSALIEMRKGTTVVRGERAFMVKED